MPRRETSTAEREALQAAKDASFAQLLFRCARLVDERAIERARTRYRLPMLRASHTSLFPHIDLEGTRLTELARRVGISKQAVGQLVDDLVQMGALERIPDPDDGRAKLIRFARRRGRISVFEGLELLREIEDELVERIGQRHARALHAALAALHEALQAPQG